MLFRSLIQNALSPAKIVAVFADPDEKTAKVVVPDYQLSLAIGKEGQNARLAARLTGYKIDIKSETQAKDTPGFRYEDYMDEYEDDDMTDYEPDGAYESGGVCESDGAYESEEPYDESGQAYESEEPYESEGEGAYESEEPYEE